jgi:hypothetical protein
MADLEHIDELGVGLPPAANLPKVAVITGQVMKIEEPYPREVPVGKGLVALMLVGATAFRLVVLLLAAILRTKAAPGDGRGWRALCKGPEFRVTPVWIRDTDGLFVEVEVQGYLSGRALRRRDLVQVDARRQDGRHLPMRAHRIDNLTAGRMIMPRRPTVWTHLGPGLMIQATLGLMLLGFLLVSGWIGS